MRKTGTRSQSRKNLANLKKGTPVRTSSGKTKVLGKKRPPNVRSTMTLADRRKQEQALAPKMRRRRP